jgi:hypothetical protein
VHKFSFKLLSCFVATISVASPASSQTVLEPPFGLHWGDSPEKLVQWATRLALDVTISLPGNQPTLKIIKINRPIGNLPDTEASGVEGRFVAGKLFELTVHYQDSDATADQMEARFIALRKQISQNQGPLLAGQQQREVVDQYVTRTQSFHREAVKGLFLLLAFSEIEDLPRNTRISRFSLIYRNENL